MNEDINQLQDPNLVAPAEPTPEQIQQTAIQNRLFNFSEAKPDLQQLHTNWKAEEDATLRRRLLRNVDLSPKKLREEGKLKADETIIPIRIIDTNIKREQPAYLNYLIAPQRTCIFTCLDDISQQTENLEREFTNLTRYIEWDIPHYKVLDGSQTHGWDSLEVVFDASKPGHFALEHCGHENLFFSKDALQLDPCLQISRKYSVSLLQLDEFVTKYKFDAEQVRLLKQALEAPSKQDTNVTIFKRLFKFQGVVYVAWYSLDVTSDWLLKPAKLFLGIKHQVTKQVPTQQLVPNPMTGQPEVQQVMIPQTEWVPTDITQYPIFILPYSETEEQTIISHKGRVFYDNFTQEAMTCIGSGYVNGVTRASNIYGAVKTDKGSSSAPKQLETSLANGAIFDQPIEFFNTPFPDPSTLTGLQYFKTQNSEEAGQIAFAVSNRQDSRKTATEVATASQQQATLSTVQVALYSTFLRKVYSFVWLIVQSQALQNQITLLPITSQELNPLTNQFVPTKKNDVEKISKNYLIKPAGDTDVIERDSLINSMRQDWPVIAQTPLAAEFLKELIRRRYPLLADKWLGMMDQQTDLKALVGQMIQTVGPLLDPAKLANMPPQQMQQAMQMVQQVQAAIAPPTPISTPTTQQQQTQQQ